MSLPTWRDWKKQQVLVRYLKWRPRLEIHHKFQTELAYLTTFIDSDWAGCPHSRRSTSGGLMLHCTHLIKSRSKTHAAVALSSAEAGLYASVKGPRRLWA